MSRTFSLPWVVVLMVVGSALAAASAAAASANAPNASVSANTLAEVSFDSTVDRRDPFNEVELDVVFTDPSGTARTVPAFWDGGRRWKVRYASGVVGEHHFKTRCSDASDMGLNGVEGTVRITPYDGKNPLYLHGPVRVAESKRWLEHADGTPFFWLGDTWWMGLCKRLEWPADFQRLTADRKDKGFTVVQIVAGLYPDMPAFDERGANEAGLPWEKDYARINPAYFDAADRRIEYLVDQGIVPCVVGAWGYHLPWLGQQKMRQHERYVYARWGALPIIWCLAGELNLPFYLSPDFPNHGQAQTAEWEKVIAYARSINAFGRPITAHPTGIAPLSMRGVLKDPALLDFDMLQTPHGQMEVIGPTVEAVRFSTSARPPMPTVDAEPSYEKLFDRTPPAVVRRVFWVCWAGGVKGYTYGANGIWQINRRDKPYGNSPWGGGYGRIAWDEAMNLPGSTQVALGKKLMSGYAWQTFEPHPEWAAWAEDSRPALGDWVWFPEGDPATDAPVAARAFRRRFDLPADARAIRATLSATADDRCTVWLNGEPLGKHEDWHTLARYDAIAPKLKPGRNVIAILAENLASNVKQNPAGLIAAVSIELEGGKKIEIKSDADWRASQQQPQGWEKPDFDDSTWPKSKVVAPLGGGPWGNTLKTQAGDKFDTPYAFGIEAGVRFVYLPDPRTVALTGLDPKTAYAGFYFDPVSGKRTKLDSIGIDAGGDSIIPPPKLDRKDDANDWVLVVEPARK